MLARLPLNIAATTGGTAVYTVGSQKWNGKRPSLTLKATKNPTAIRIAAFASETAIRSPMRAISRVPVTPVEARDRQEEQKRSEEVHRGEHQARSKDPRRAAIDRENV